MLPVPQATSSKVTALRLACLIRPSTKAVSAEESPVTVVMAGERIVTCHASSMLER